MHSACQQALANAANAAQSLEELANCQFPSEAETYHATVAGIHRLCAALLNAETEGAPPSALRAAAEPARLLHAKSPFVQRLQTWPRGYPGDYETIEYICDGEPKIAPGTVEHAIEVHTLRDISAQQHRNKVAWQARLMLETVLDHPDARVLSIACGGCRDLRSIEPILAGRGARFFLNDMDADALALAAQCLPRLHKAIETIQGDVFKAVRGLRRLAPLDLIVAGGLFDYLDNGKILWLLDKLWPLLREGGRICFTNLATGNPDRIWLQYIANWQIIDRNEKEVRNFVAELRPKPQSVSVSREATGLTFLVEIVKPAE